MEQTAVLTSYVPAPMLDYELEQTEIDATVTESLALMLFETGRITSGRAAALLGIPRLAFLALLHKRGIQYINLTREELEKEMEVLDELLPQGPA